LGSKKRKKRKTTSGVKRRQWRRRSRSGRALAALPAANSVGVAAGGLLGGR